MGWVNTHPIRSLAQQGQLYAMAVYRDKPESTGINRNSARSQQSLKYGTELCWELLKVGFQLASKAYLLQKPLGHQLSQCPCTWHSRAHKHDPPLCALPQTWRHPSFHQIVLLPLSFSKLMWRLQLQMLSHIIHLKSILTFKHSLSDGHRHSSCASR